MLRCPARAVLDLMAVASAGCSDTSVRSCTGESLLGRCYIGVGLTETNGGSSVVSVVSSGTMLPFLK